MAACDEAPIWTSAPVPLLRAIADRDLRLVTEWVDGRQDLDRPRPLAESGLSRLGTWQSGSLVRPLDLAVALEQPAIAARLVEGGAVVGAAAGPLACLTVFRGTPADLTRLHARGLAFDSSLTCATPEAGTLEALARRNGDAMITALRSVGEPASR